MNTLDHYLVLALDLNLPMATTGSALSTKTDEAVLPV